MRRPEQIEQILRGRVRRPEPESRFTSGNDPPQFYFTQAGPSESHPKEKQINFRMKVVG